jgi:hypothetical protein
MSFIILKRNEEITVWIDENGRYGSENRNEIEKTRKKMKIITRIAEQKFKKVSKDIGCDNFKLLDPFVWLFNQDLMREMWESFKYEMENTEIGKYLLNNSFAEYQQFMYDNFPKNYTKNVIRHENIGDIDGAEIYLILEKINL